MKKIIAILLALIIVLSMATPALAVSPALPAPDMPEIPDLSDGIDFDIDFGGIVDGWLEEHPMPPMLPIETTCPTEPSAPIDWVGSNDEVELPAQWSWMDWIRGWFRWMPGCR